MDVRVADDDAGSRPLASAAVEQLGDGCTVAEDGTEARSRQQAERPDWQMPGMDGAAPARAIRSQQDAPYAYVGRAHRRRRARDRAAPGMHDGARNDVLTGLGDRLRLAGDLDVLSALIARHDDLELVGEAEDAARRSS